MEHPPIDDLAALRLQLEWGADEALEDAAVDRFRASARPGAQAPVAAVPPAAAPLASPAATARALATAAADLDALRAALEGFEGCDLRHTAGSLVFGAGPAEAPLVVIAEAPDEADDASGRPLSGAAGAVLARVLGHAGIGPAMVRVVCLVPWRPPGGRPASPNEVACCLPFLEAQLRLLDARVAVLLGATVARALTGAQGTVRQLRGDWREVRLTGRPTPLEALVMMPPSQFMSTPKSRRATWADTLMLRRKLATFCSF